MSYNNQNRAIHNVYMHLIDGKPVTWNAKEKTLYFSQNGDHRTDIFRESLDQIYEEQRADAETRRKAGLDNWGSYGYLRLRVGNK